MYIYILFIVYTKYVSEPIPVETWGPRIIKLNFFIDRKSRIVMCSISRRTAMACGKQYVLYI